MQYPINDKKKWSKAKKITILSILVSQSIILSYFERFIPLQLFIPVPGVRLGLANIITLTAIYIFSPIEAFGVVALRASLVSLLFGTPVTFMYSFAGGVLSFIVMLILVKTCKDHVTPIGVSVCGAIFHNIGQLTMAALILQNTNIFYYLAYLMLTGVITGILIGITVKYLMSYLIKVY